MTVPAWQLVPEADVDFETRSYADLKKVGAWAYSEDPTTDVICFCYDLNDGKGIRNWWPGADVECFPGTEMPRDLYEFVAAGGRIVAFNVAFEFCVWKHVCVTKYGWIMPADDQWRDIQATAFYYSLPPSLDKVAMVLGFEGKDPEGDRLITKYSKLHLKTAKLDIPDDDFDKFVRYCRKDVMIEQSVDDYLGFLPDREWPIWQLDQAINRRGLYLDINGIEMAAKLVDERAEQLTEEFRALTGFNPTQLAKFKEWTEANGLKLPDCKADTLNELLEEGELGQGPVRRAIEIRTEINKASTKKLDAMARQRAQDGRAHFQCRYHGTGTGRTTGTGFQPLNLVRSFEKIDPSYLVDNIMFGDLRWLDCVYGNSMTAISKASRHWIMAEPGNKIVAGDFVSIEAVVLACLAGEEWKIKAFRDKVKIYELMADKIYNLPPGTVTKDTHPAERQDGKTGELAFGYQGALGAWLKFDSSGRHTDERIIEICKSWRAEHPMIVALWRGLEEAAIEAVNFPGRETFYRNIGFEMVDEWLSMILPNGKRIWYWKPEIRLGMPGWHKPMVNEDCAAGACDCRPVQKLTYMAQKEGQWRRVATYGGKLTENATQATSRELLQPAVRRAESYGYHVILTVYDEVVSEVPAWFGSKHEFEEILVGDGFGGWARGWPISVDAWEGPRYKK